MSLEAAFRYIDERARSQTDPFERRAIFRQRRLVLGAALEKFPRDMRQSALRDAPEIVDIERLFIVHFMERDTGRGGISICRMFAVF